MNEFIEQECFERFQENTPWKIHTQKIPTWNIPPISLIVILHLNLRPQMRGEGTRTSNSLDEKF